VIGAQDQQGPAVYGDAAYGTGKLLAVLETAGAQIFTKVQPPTAPGGRYAKDRFSIDLHAGTVTCPNAVTVTIRPATAGGGTAVFGSACASCPMAAQCTGAAAGRTGIGTLQSSTWPAGRWNHSSRRLRRDSTRSWNKGVSVRITSSAVRSSGATSAATRMALIGRR